VKIGDVTTDSDDDQKEIQIDEVYDFAAPPLED
jgi:hypothetical protein